VLLQEIFTSSARENLYFLKIAVSNSHYLVTRTNTTLVSIILTRISSKRVPWSTLRNSWSQGSMSSVLFSLFSSSSGGGGSSLWWVAHWMTFGTTTNNCWVNKFIDFHVAVCLFVNRSQMMSKCGKNKEVAQEPLG